MLITLLAEEPSKTGPDFGKASPVGLLVVVLLLIGVFALVWSMNRHLKRLPQSFDEPDGDQSRGIPDTRTEAHGAAGEAADRDAGEQPREPGG